MTKIDANLMAVAKKIANELNKKDGSVTDNRITRKYWNQFVADKGGRTVNEYIMLPRAEISIYTYLKRNADSKKEREDLGEKWLSKLSEITEEQQQENEPHTVDGVPEVNNTSKRRDVLNDIKLPEDIVIPEATRVETSVATNVVKPAFFEFSKSRQLDTSAIVKTENNKNVEELIKEELKKRGLSDEAVDIPYWEEKIQKVSSRFNIPEEIIVSIISKETRFKKNVSGVNGRGAMQLTGIAIRSFFPGAKGSWFDLYKQMDSKLLNDILYKRDMFGRIIMKDNKPVLKYSSWNELLRACGKDDELSIKVGSLIFEMKYVEAVAAEKLGRSNWVKIPMTIEKLQSGEFELDENTNKKCISQAIKNYNGNNAVINIFGTATAVKDDYQRDVMDSLRKHDFDFAAPIVKRS